jgi:RNA polymerase subunit RPABC4/transcription elongation factor Spt4
MSTDTCPRHPPGYQMGYWDGYVVVYDPITYFIANVIDLLQ